jgi:general secretion pathway protein I
MTISKAPATRRASSGFTLIEVLAALVIVSLGMMAVIQAVSQTASNSAYLHEKSVAHWIALNRVTEMRLALQPPPTGESSGEVEMSGARWHWSAVVVATQLASMRRIDVSVARASDAKAGADGENQLATITGFYGEKIAKPGTVIADFNSPPPNSQPNNPVHPNPPAERPGGNPIKPAPPPDSDGTTP